MKAILISIKPRFVADILNGKKALEIRKTFPKCKYPIDVYIYCTRENIRKTPLFVNSRVGNGKVVAKFTLRKIKQVSIWDENLETKTLGPACLDCYEFDAYTKGHVGYAWHIDDLVVFDKPMELYNFKHPTPDICGKRDENGLVLCGKCIYGREYQFYCECLLPTVKAPQSWCYVELNKNIRRR